MLDLLERATAVDENNLHLVEETTCKCGYIRNRLPPGILSPPRILVINLNERKNPIRNKPSDRIQMGTWVFDLAGVVYLQGNCHFHSHTKDGAEYILYNGMIDPPCRRHTSEQYAAIKDPLAQVWYTRREPLPSVRVEKSVIDLDAENEEDSIIAVAPEEDPVMAVNQENQQDPVTKQVYPSVHVETIGTTDPDAPNQLFEKKNSAQVNEEKKIDFFDGNSMERLRFLVRTREQREKSGKRKRVYPRGVSLQTVSMKGRSPKMSWMQ
jgi:hypothetical protein